jgi:hypothetical protein
MLTETYVAQKDKGTTLLRCDDNNGEDEAPQCYMYMSYYLLTETNIMHIPHTPLQKYLYEGCPESIRPF